VGIIHRTTAMATILNMQSLYVGFLGEEQINKVFNSLEKTLGGNATFAVNGKVNGKDINDNYNLADLKELVICANHMNVSISFCGFNNEIMILFGFGSYEQLNCTYL
jgi:hypothetical protein